MGFMDYLNNFEKKMTEPKPEVKKTVAPVQKIITEEKQTNPQQKVIVKRIIKIVKEPVYIDRATGQIIESKNVKIPVQPKKVVDMKNPLNHAANILDEMVEGASIGSYYAPTLPEEKVIPKKEAANVRNRAMDILGDDDTPQPSVFQMSEEMLRHVPKEMTGGRPITPPPQPQHQTFNENIQHSSQPNVPPEINKMMEDAQRFQNMFAQNVDMGDALKQAQSMGLV